MLPVCAAAESAEILGVQVPLPEGHDVLVCGEALPNWPEDGDHLSDCVGVLSGKSTSPSWFYRPFTEAGWRAEGDAFLLIRECDTIFIENIAARAAPYERILLFTLEPGGYCRANRGGID